MSQRPPADNPAPDALLAALLLRHHGISRLPEVEGDKPGKKKIPKFKRYPIGYFHIDIVEVRTAEGKFYLFVAIDRTSKFAYAELHEKAAKMAAAQFLRDLVAAVLYAIHTVLTDGFAPGVKAFTAAVLGGIGTPCSP